MGGKNSVLVLGSTGSIGIETIKSLSQFSHVRIYAGMRDLAKAGKAGFSELENVTPVKVEFGNKAEVTAVIKANKINTVLVIPPGHEDRRTISIASIQGAAEAKLVEHIMVMSIVSVPYEDTKFAKHFIGIENAVVQSNIPYTIIRLPLFTENILAHVKSIKEEGKIYGPCNGSKPLANITVADAGMCIAKLLSDPKRHQRKVYMVSSHVYTYNELAAAFSKILGKRIDYAQVSYPDANEAFLKMGFEEWQAKGILELYKLIDEEKGELKTKGDMEQILGRTGCSIHEYVNEKIDFFYKNVLILGSSGSIGKATVNALAHKHGIRIFAGMRSTVKASVLGYDKMDSVICVSVDLGNSAAVFSAVNEYQIDAVFVIPPGVKTREQLTLQAIQGLKDAGVGFTLLLTVLSIPFKDTIFAKQMIPLEEAMRASGLAYTIMRLPLFTENILAYVDSIKEKSKFFGPLLPDSEFASVTTTDAGLCAASILDRPIPHLNQTYRIVSDVYCQNRLAAALTKSLGKKIEYERVSYEQSKASFQEMGFPDWQIDGILELYKLIDCKETEMSFLGDIESVLGEKTRTSIEDFVESVKEAFKKRDKDVATPKNKVDVTAL